ncbi:NitT/TauT family transport system substrate-binding protein/sulfonate transport system substrate-binding protein [Methylobacterium phyllostachyos]|uniref:Putative aliphatic sulfonates-binding protein n=1 Tax=Methylobacterium phyllostachyos TaxID=582672 RepID=A0A1H0DH61_9HYPH|nr:aliphatic sulfonate ABC transporter substrate-binding protein [Methylobacterium phyllostachyos]SDN69485.1 NitT/TauT family transport system substrate-binding protein/sulfonate transport system substrate-binding protein [Methylobacterium phyllostachyos]
MLDRRSLLAALATLPVARRARAAESDTVRIGYQKNGILVVAKQQGRIEERLAPLGRTVRWVEFSFGPPMVEALAVDGLDFGLLGDAPPIFAQARGSDLVYVAALEGGGSGSGILLPKGSTLRSLADLKGKRVAFAKATSAHNLTVAALEKAGLAYTDIEPVLLAPADAAAAFARGSVDAWTIWDPYLAIAEAGEGVRALAYATAIAPQNNFLLARRAFVEGQGPALVAALAALDEVAAWCRQNRGAVAELLSQGTGVPLAATRRAVDRNDYVIGPMTDRIVAAQQQVADRFHALKLIPKPVRIADAVWTAPARNG